MSPVFITVINYLQSKEVLDLFFRRTEVTCLNNILPLATVAQYFYRNTFICNFFKTTFPLCIINIQGPPNKCIHTLTKENSMLYNRLL